MSIKITSSLGKFFTKVEEIVKAEQERSGRRLRLNLGLSSQKAGEVELVFDTGKVDNAPFRWSVEKVAILFDRNTEAFSGVYYWQEGQI